MVQCLCHLYTLMSFFLFILVLNPTSEGFTVFSKSILHHTIKLNLSSNEDNNNNYKPQVPSGIDVSVDPRLYKVRVPRAPGIEWGTDLSFTFVYVRELDPSGPASLSGLVQKGHQLCEITPIDSTSSSSSTVATPIPLIGASFDTVMSTFASFNKNVFDIEMVFFRGTQKELKALCSSSSSSTNNSKEDTITIKVIQRNKTTNQMENIQMITSTPGINLRQVLTDHGINVYQSVTRWTNCKGKQLCGTCIVNVTDGGMYTNRKSMDETSTLRENIDTYRLSCVTFVYGDITVETFPPVNPSQLTR